MSSLSIVDVIAYTYFFFNDTATTEIYTLSLHDALPISCVKVSIGCDRDRLPEALRAVRRIGRRLGRCAMDFEVSGYDGVDRKSTRLNSSHANISYAVFCLKKKITEIDPSIDNTFINTIQ